MSDKVQELRDRRINKVVRAYERDMPLSEIARKAGVSPPTVAKWLVQEGYKHKTKGRIPLAMKARVRELHLRGWSARQISGLLKLGIPRVEQLSDPKENPILGGEKDPLKIKELKKKKAKRSKRGRPPKEKKEKGEEWPPKKHRCRKHWTENEKAYVIQLIEKGIPPATIYKRMRASKSRQIRIWREAGGDGRPPNFPPPKGPFEPRDGTPISSTEAKKARDRAKALEAAGDAKLAALEAEAAERKEKISALEAEKKADENRIKALDAAQKKLASEEREKTRRLKSAAAAMDKRKSLPEPKPIRRRVEAGSYEDEVLGLPVGSLVDKKKLGRPKGKTASDYADNGRYFTVSKDWADLADAKPDELKLFAAYLTSKRFPARVERSGDQPNAYFNNTWPKKLEGKWVRAVDGGLSMLEKYREKKRKLRARKLFSKNIAAYLISVFDGYRNPKLNSAQKAEAKRKADVLWGRLSKLEQLVMIYDMKYADADGKPTSLGVERSLAARMLVEKAAKRASRKLKERKGVTKKRALKVSTEEDEAGDILTAARGRLSAPEEPEDSEDEVDEISAMLAQAKDRLALGEGDED